MGGNTLFPKCAPLSHAYSLLQEWNKETISQKLVIGVEILDSSLLQALMIYNLPKHRFVLNFLWGLLDIYIPILVERKNCNCSSVNSLSASHRFICLLGVCCAV